MKRTCFMALAALLICGAAACSDDDDNNPTGKCSNEDTTACSNTFGTCKGQCLADESCHRQCQLDYCDCLDQASCDPPAECRDNPLDSGTDPDPDAGTTPAEDSGEVDAGEGCDGTAAAACNEAQASCLVDCLGDLTCQDACLADYCDCLFEVGCEDNENCS